MPSGDSVDRRAREIAESLLGPASPRPEPGKEAPGEGRPLGPRYLVKQEIGHGGMGTVLEGWDLALGRPVALKIVRAEGELAPEVRERFIHEAEVTGRLEHPNIVPVHDLGTAPDPATGRSRPFFAMKLVEGEDLATILRRLGAGDEATRLAFSRTRLLQIFQDICMGVAFAHSRGVIHRDLKPGNVMIGRYGETLVVDWGLARVQGLGTADQRAYAARLKLAPGEPDATRLTLAGSTIGTPGYMPPEQAEGRLLDIDERSDVYALGAILRDMLRAAGPDAPADLHRLAARAMSPAPADRFASPRDLHDEIQLHLEGARERERRRALAEEKAEDGRRLAMTLPVKRAERDRVAGEAKELLDAVKAGTPLEEKRRAWGLEDRAAELRREFLDAFTAAHGAFSSALGVDAECAAARGGLAALYWDAFLEAEEAGDADRMRLYRGLLEQVDGSGYAERLRGDGALSVSVRRHPCDCMRTAGAHGASCRTVPVEDADVFIFETVEQDRRLVPSRPRSIRPAGNPPDPFQDAAWLGRAPLARFPLPMGRWIAVVAAPGFLPARLPFRAARQEHVSLDVTLYRPEEIPEGFVQVAGGPFVVGGDRDAEQPERTPVNLPDFFISRTAVTSREWLDFLNDLPPAEAAAHVPRADANLAPIWSPAADGRFSLPPATHPLEPVSGIAWTSATAFAAWASRRQGRRLSLPHDNEWEKAARSPDGRFFPWGDRFDPGFCNSRGAFPEGPRMAPAGSFPADESPYGALDMAGNAATWCRNGVDAESGGWRAVRGGSCMNVGSLLRAAYRFGIRPHIIRPYVGVRLVLHPLEK